MFRLLHLDCILHSHPARHRSLPPGQLLLGCGLLCAKGRRSLSQPVRQCVRIPYSQSSDHCVVFEVYRPARIPYSQSPSHCVVFQVYRPSRIPYSQSSSHCVVFQAYRPSRIPYSQSPNHCVVFEVYRPAMIPYSQSSSHWVVFQVYRPSRILYSQSPSHCVVFQVYRPSRIPHMYRNWTSSAVVLVSAILLSLPPVALYDSDLKGSHFTLRNIWHPGATASRMCIIRSR